MARIKVSLPGHLFVVEMEHFQSVMDVLEKVSFIDQPYLSDEDKELYPNRSNYYSYGQDSDFSILPAEATIDLSQKWYEYKNGVDKIRKAQEEATCEEEG